MTFTDRALGAYADLQNTRLRTYEAQTLRSTYDLLKALQDRFRIPAQPRVIRGQPVAEHQGLQFRFEDRFDGPSLRVRWACHRCKRRGEWRGAASLALVGAELSRLREHLDFEHGETS